MHILAISGSLRADSYNTALARAAAEHAPAATWIEVYDRLGELPPYDQDLDGEDAPEAVRDLRRRIASADALLIVTPEYNGSIPGVLKNAIDWASRPRRAEAAIWGKTIAVAGASTGQYGAIWAQQDLRRVLGITGARVIEGELPVSKAHEAFDSEGRLSNAILAERLRTHLAALVDNTAPAAIAA
ncbi:MAG TPA: NADPH-dependent FMN reductase [Gaiellaceae bacterium]|nr:NADPH-dependent FMN reductase [Gaiellaceae bacterium]